MRAHVRHTHSARQRWKTRRKHGIQLRRVHKLNVQNREKFGIFGNQYVLIKDAFRKDRALSNLRRFYSVGC